MKTTQFQKAVMDLAGLLLITIAITFMASAIIEFINHFITNQQ